MTRNELIIKLAVASYLLTLTDAAEWVSLDAWRDRAIEAADVLLAALDQQSPPTHAAVDREFLGKAVRLEWIKWAQEQPNPKPSWLLPWDQLTEPEREVDRRIGERIYNLSMIPYDTHSTAAPGGEPKERVCVWKLTPHRHLSLRVNPHNERFYGKADGAFCPGCGGKIITEAT